jgi:hypothetical protein
MKIIRGLRFDWYISSSSGKVVWEFLIGKVAGLSKGRGGGSDLKSNLSLPHHTEARVAWIYIYLPTS